MESNWHQAPFLRLVIPLIAGVAAGFYLLPGFILLDLFLAATLLGIIILFVFSKHWKYRQYDLVFGVIATACLFYVGVALSMAQAEMNEKVLELPPRSEYYIGEVLDFPEIKERSVRILVELKAAYANETYSALSDVKVLAYAPKAYQLDTLTHGDYIAFRSVPSSHKKPINPGQFDYGAYLQKRGVAGTVFFHQSVLVSRPPNNSLAISTFFSQLQNYCVQVFRSSGLDSRELGVASVVVDRSRLFQ